MRKYTLYEAIPCDLVSILNGKAMMKDFTVISIQLNTNVVPVTAIAFCQEDEVILQKKEVPLTIQDTSNQMSEMNKKTKKKVII